MSIFGFFARRPPVVPAQDNGPSSQYAFKNFAPNEGDIVPIGGTFFPPTAAQFPIIHFSKLSGFSTMGAIRDGGSPPNVHHF